MSILKQRIKDAKSVAEELVEQIILRDSLKEERYRMTHPNQTIKSYADGVKLIDANKKYNKTLNQIQTNLENAEEFIRLQGTPNEGTLYSLLSGTNSEDPEESTFFAIDSGDYSFSIFDGELYTKKLNEPEKVYLAADAQIVDKYFEEAKSTIDRKIPKMNVHGYEYANMLIRTASIFATLDLKQSIDRLANEY